jgi:hypothetical protein
MPERSRSASARKEHRELHALDERAPFHADQEVAVADDARVACRSDPESWIRNEVSAPHASESAGDFSE